MQRKKNIRLLIVLATLMVAVVLLQLDFGKKDNLGVDRKLFQLDPNREINRVVLEGPEETNVFDFQNGRWHLNDTLFLDQSMRDVFFSVVSQLEIRRPVLESKADSIAQLIEESGVQTTISFGDEMIQQYWVGGNSQQQVSWIMGNDKVPYQVHIPGYQSYVAGIFKVPASDWRSRFLLDVNFALINAIEIEYPETDEKLTLKYENSFFTVPSVRADSLKVAEFLESLSFLQANNFLDSRDSTVGAEPGTTNLYAILQVHLVNGSTTEIRFFNDPENRRFYLAELEDGSMAQIDKRALATLFKKPVDFE